MGRNDAKPFPRKGRGLSASCGSSATNSHVAPKQPAQRVHFDTHGPRALAAVLGGCQSLHSNSMDETLAPPSEHAVTLALRPRRAGSSLMRRASPTCTQEIAPAGRRVFPARSTPRAACRRRRFGEIPPRDRRVTFFRLPEGGGTQAENHRQHQRLPAGRAAGDQPLASRRRGGAERAIAKFAHV